MQRRTWLIAALILVLLPLAISCERENRFEESSAYKVTSRSQLIGGPKALGQIGDYVLENDKIRVIINGQASDWSGGGLNKWGGSIIDADLRRYEDDFDPMIGGNDCFLELVPVFDIKFFGIEQVYGSGPVVRVAQDSVEILDDGADGGEARIKVSGKINDLIALMKLIPVPLNYLPVRAETIYSLKPSKNYVKLTTTFTLLNRDESDPSEIYEVPLEPIAPGDNALFAMFQGDIFGDSVFYGDSVDAFGPGVFGFSSSWYTEEMFRLGKSTISETPMIPWSAGVAEGIGYGLVSRTAPLAFPIMEDFLTLALQMKTPKTPEDATGGIGLDYILPEPGYSYTYERYFIVDEGDVAGILNHVIDIKNWPSATVAGNVFDEATGQAASDAKVLLFPHPILTRTGEPVPVKKDFDEMNRYLKGLAADDVDYHRLIPYSRFTTDSLRQDTADDGSFEGKVPVDEETGRARYILMASGPGNTKSQLIPIEVKSGGTKEVSLVLPATGTIHFNVRSLDQNGPTEPCKVTIVGLNREAKGDPFIGESWLPADEAKVIHTMNGQGETQLPAGRYRVIANRGPEYLADEKIVDLAVMQTVDVDLVIDRVVDTSGWIAADQHIHSQHSSDSGVLVEDRVKSLMVEALDLAVATDHDFITNYFPSLQALGGIGLVKVLAGDELSHFSYAHFCSYPLKYDQTAVSGGAPNWRMPSPSTELPDGSVMPLYTPQDCFDALRARTDHDLVDQEAMVVINHTQESFTGYLRAFGWDQYYNKFGTPDFLTVGDPVVNNGKLLAKDASANFSFDFDGIEVMNSKRWEDVRTCTEEEISDNGPERPLLPVYIRTADEQLRILSGDLILDHTNRGMLDDYMSLIAFGKRVAGLGNSDTHSTSKNEVGKCRTYIMSSTDDPKHIDVNEYITNLKAGRAIVTNGPFIESWVDGKTIGSDVFDDDGSIDIRIRAQAAPHISLDRLEIYGNGILIGEIGADTSEHFMGCHTEGTSIRGRDSVVRFDGTISCEAPEDTFIVVVGIGYTGMTPYIQPVEGPAVEISDSAILGINQILDDWLGIGAVIPSSVYFERQHDIYPFAVTNAIYVDTDGIDQDGDGYAWDAPGYIPGWFDEEEINEVFADQDNLSMLMAAKNKVLSLTTKLMTPQQSQTGAEQEEADEDARNGGCGGGW